MLALRLTWLAAMTQAMFQSITEKGITAKHLLVASSQGAILDLPLHMVSVAW